MTGRTGVAPLLVACLLLSGAAALIYEVVWMRELALVMGHTVYALAALLTAFLGGLALGAHVGGRWAARHAVSFRLYAVLELAIAAGALAMPVLVQTSTPLFGAAYRSLGHSFVAYNLVQLLVCGGILLPPAMLMGATLPIVTALVAAEGPPVARTAAYLYAANTLGGALGAGLAGYWLLPAVGMIRTTLVAAALNLMAATAAWVCSQRVTSMAGGSRQVDPGRRAARETWPSPGAGMLVALYGLAGFSSLVLEVAWARLVGLSIGSTTYGFTITLLSFIVGIALGSALVPRLRPLVEHPVRAVFVLQSIIAVWSLASLPYVGTLPVRVVELFAIDADRFWLHLLGQHILVWATILVPTLAMGCCFPLVTALLDRSLHSAPRAIGSAYAANTWGNILGAFMAGFVLVPTLGMRTTIVISALLSGAVAAGFLAPGARLRPLPALGAMLGLAGLLGALTLWAPHWDRELITSGGYLYGRMFLPAGDGTPAAHLEDALRNHGGRLVDYREGATAVVSVKTHGADLSLQVNGKSDAFSFASTQNFIAHLPLLLHAGPQDVLVLGLGSGSTLGSTLTHPVRRVDSVEISPEVYALARKHFGRFTGNALDDPRARVIIGDGRNHLRHTRQRYDVIVSQPSNPWMTGSASLFTREFFADVRAHLAPHGIACAWFMASGDEEEVMRSVLGTWSDVFPHAYLFQSRLVGEYVLLGLVDGTPLSAGHVAAELLQPRVAGDLGRLGMVEAADVLGYLLLGPEGIRRYAAGATLNTDDTAFIEFAAPHGLGASDSVGILEGLHRHRQPAVDLVDTTLSSVRATEALDARLRSIFQSKTAVLRALQLEKRHGRTGEWRAAVAEAAALNPRDPYVLASMPASR